ncbi:TerC family protein [Sphingobacteriales bacterium UPWRP_1]|nr:hypothetical protein BVG80_06025 [Sphingobacteriales bacterium TSM_CSM]PSJ76759.1 TerC family protein [Sphingobacteriales bacterium UPWRP_1]
MEMFLQPDVWISLLTLTLMEVVLGIDNLVFLSIVSGRLPAGEQEKARRLGLVLALGFRILLLLGISWIVGLTQPVLSFHNFGMEFDLSWRDIILIAGGLFLLYKATTEIHHKLEGVDFSQEAKQIKGFGAVVVQILLLDMVFSFDSILTAVGLVKHVEIMIIAVVISMIIMLVFVNKISAFIERHPSVKMLALSFLLLIGVMLLAEGFHQHVPKGYIYFAMFFSLGVEMLNMRVKKSADKPVHLNQ